jgi:hypothetical protein
MLIHAMKMRQRRKLRLASRIWIVAFLALLLSACSNLALTSEPIVSATISTPPNTPSATPSPTQTPFPTATPTLTPTPSGIWIEPSGVRVHPDGGLYSGDTLSFQVEAHNGSTADVSHLPVIVDWGANRATGKIDYLPRGGSGTANLPWVWSTASISGTHTVTVTLDPQNVSGSSAGGDNAAVIQVDLAADRPLAEIGAKWQTLTSVCCTIHYISGTAAERDIRSIAKTADEAIAFVESRLSTTQTRRLEVYLISRVLGHGGFAGDAIAISHLDRDYAGGGLLEVLRHEGTHMIDRRMADGERPSLLVEGFAVYITGGHFKLESLPERAAALLTTQSYIPLRDLANNFYPSQHETGYMEGGAFIDYLVTRGGFKTFVDLYDGMQRKSGESDADMIDREMQAVYGVGLDEMEREWQAYLRTLTVGDEERRDVADTITFYDTVRRYQHALDPSAYFLGVWIPDIQEARARRLVADYLRHPRAPENIALETMLVAAHEAIAARDNDRGETLLASVNAVLDAGVRFDDPIAARYLEVVQTALAAGYEPQRLTLDGDHADVQATREGEVTLLSLSAALQNGAWSLGLSQ